MTKQKKTISIDFDGVIIEKAFGADWRTQKKSSRSKKGLGLMIFMIFDKWWTGLNHIWRKPIEGSIEGLRRLKADGHKLVLLTSRYGYRREITMRWIEKWGIKDLYSDFYFNERNIGAIDSKIENAAIIKPDIHIDDNKATVAELAKKYPDLKLWYLSSKEDIDGYKNVLTAKNWSEIEK